MEAIILNLEKEIISLIKSKPFFAHFIQNMRRIITDEIDTLGVNITDQINLYVNPEFFNSLKPYERVACLEHEVLHIISKHIFRVDKRNPMIWNIACDLCCNQYLPTQKRNGNIISQLPEGTLDYNKFKFEKNLKAEDYYTLLLKNAKRLNISLDGDGNPCLDDHGKWKEGNTNEDFQHEVIKRAIKNTIEKTQDYGNLPDDVVAEIKKALRHKTLNWRRILQKFVYRATLVHSVATRKKPNRRFGFLYDGSKVECKLNMLVAIDTSGSISDEDLSLFFSEINKISSLGMNIMIVECDTEIHKTYKYKKIPSVVTGRGGTEFKPVFDFASKCSPKPDCIVYLTDLYADLSFKNISRIPTLWAITIDGGEETDIPFGTGVKLKDDKI